MSKNNKIVIGVASAAVLLILLFTATYAYFTANMGNTETSTIVTTGGYLQIVYDETGGNITINNVYPSSSVVATKTFNLVGKSGEDFSYLPDIERKRPVILTMHTLKDVINKTIFAVSNVGENNPVLKGELIEIEGNSLRVVGMDGHRIAIKNVKYVLFVI